MRRGRSHKAKRCFLSAGGVIRAIAEKHVTFGDIVAQTLDEEVERIKVTPLGYLDGRGRFRYYERKRRGVPRPDHFGRALNTANSSEMILVRTYDYLMFAD